MLKKIILIFFALLSHNSCFSMSPQPSIKELVQSAYDELKQPCCDYVRAKKQLTYVRKFFELNQSIIPEQLSSIFAFEIKQAQDQEAKIESLKLCMLRLEMPTDTESLKIFHETTSSGIAEIMSFSSAMKPAYEYVQHLLTLKTKIKKQNSHELQEKPTLSEL